MGKSTSSMTIFNSYLSHYQRVQTLRWKSQKAHHHPPAASDCSGSSAASAEGWTPHHVWPIAIFANNENNRRLSGSFWHILTPSRRFCQKNGSRVLRNLNATKTLAIFGITFLVLRFFLRPLGSFRFRGSGFRFHQILCSVCYMWWSRIHSPGPNFASSAAPRDSAAWLPPSVPTESLGWTDWTQEKYICVSKRVRKYPTMGIISPAIKSWDMCAYIYILYYMCYIYYIYIYICTEIWW